VKDEDSIVAKEMILGGGVLWGGEECLGQSLKHEQEATAVRWWH
jgi:hypothetical protein